MREFDRKVRCLACEDTQGQIRGVLPLIETHGLPLNRTMMSTGRRLATLPRTPMAGPLVLDEQAAVVVLRAANELVRGEPERRIELKTIMEGIDKLVEELLPIPWRLNYVLELPNEPEVIRFRSSYGPANIKRAVSKALRSGVEVRRGVSKNDRHIWYQLYLETMRSVAVPPRPHRIFASLGGSGATWPDAAASRRAAQWAESCILGISEGLRSCGIWQKLGPEIQK